MYPASMAIDHAVSEITTVAAAQEFDRYLLVTPPPPPREWLDMMSELEKRTAQFDAIIEKGMRIESKGDVIAYVKKNLPALLGVPRWGLWLFSQDEKRELKEAYQDNPWAFLQGLKDPLPQEDKEMLERMRMADDECERKLRKFVDEQGVSYDAFLLTTYAGDCIARSLRLENSDKKSLQVTGEQLQVRIDGAVQEGIYLIEERYWISIKGVQKPQIINEDFQKRASAWLYEEITVRLGADQTVRVLDSAEISSEGGQFVMRPCLREFNL